MVDVELVATMCIAAFAGGAFGAMIGALHSFIFTGFVIIIGEAINRIHGGDSVSSIFEQTQQTADETSDG